MLDETETYPSHSAFPSNMVKQTCGLTKREYFAAMAMQSFLLNDNDFYTCRFVANRAVCVADALIDALNGPKEQP